jgi:hypothetical protein
VIPCRCFSAGPSYRWDVVSGWLHVVVAWPSDGQNGTPGAARMKAFTAARPPASSKHSTCPAPPGSNRFARSWSGWSGRPG